MLLNWGWLANYKVDVEATKGMKQTNSCSPKEAAVLPHLSALFHKTPCFVWGLVKVLSAFIYLLFSPSVCFLRQLGVRDAMVKWGERIIAKETLWKQLDDSVKDFQLIILHSFCKYHKGRKCSCLWAHTWELQKDTQMLMSAQSRPAMTDYQRQRETARANAADEFIEE